MKRVILVAASVGLVVALAACSPSATHSPVATGHAVTALPKPVAVSIPVVSGSLNGVYEANDVKDYAPIIAFGKETGATPHIALYYSGGEEPFQSAFAKTARIHDDYTLVQMQPSVSLAMITAGVQDVYFKRFALAVKAFKTPVILSFAHEMNGGWYTWGTENNTPAQFIAAWRHVVSVFRAEGATNVTWLWTVNAVNPQQKNVKAWWPGASWVTWVGVDGYYYYPSDSFADVFGTTISEIKSFTNTPVIIPETAVGPSSQAATQVSGLFAAIKNVGILGEVWFDEGQNDPPYHQDWHLADDPAALQAFRTAAG